MHIVRNTSKLFRTETGDNKEYHSLDNKPTIYKIEIIGTI